MSVGSSSANFSKADGPSVTRVYVRVMKFACESSASNTNPPIRAK